MSSRNAEKLPKIDAGLQHEVLELLRGSEADLFLTELIFALTIAARAEYGEAGTMPPLSGARLRPYNELMHRISAKLLQLRGAADAAGYPNEVFVDILLETGETATRLLRALEDAVQRVKQRSRRQENGVDR